MNKRQPDFVLVLCVVLLLVVGALMVYSASAAWGSFIFEDSWYFAKRQALFAGLGLTVMAITTHIDYRIWKRWSLSFLLICFVLLILVLIPGVGLVRGGAQSWLGVGAFSIQPSEFMKLSLIIFLAAVLAERPEQLTSFKTGMLPLLLLIGAAFGLIMLQPDLGTGAVMVLTCMVLLFVAGGRYKHFFWLGMLGVSMFAALVAAAPYRLQRLTSFLDPWSDALGSGFQIIQSLYAIGPGGLMGLGFGESRQKYFYLPEPQTDFIFAILAEETGFIGGSLVILLFTAFMWRGIRIAMLAPDGFGTFLAVGIVGMLLIQVLINIGVVTGMFPVTGITLPFLSYGGSSLTLMLAAVGLLLSISRYIEA
ncbi:spore cortex peptidoglycan biosynthesis regulator SpoVE [Salsuginibacillus halophilus]|uniref:Spore cortex peptidoglycan biosynthesis regulator SpoVE n=1 Tax=Salsuginibacillus halophilus TaxID=517424 RepID=A0A2P8HX03_9BACI|nr:stage V sporulation protein E [Salsuginibacillus halophilus]PSL50771.1 spore cortex peptidoglycan biosynthesis regulator SpoVE [Salsuginibacillus halophilus]